MRNKKVDNYITDFALQHHDLIIILAEYNYPTTELCGMLAYKEFELGGCSRIKILLKPEYYNDEIIQETHFYTIHSISNAYSNYLIGAAHFPSKLYASEADQQAKARIFHQDIISAEEVVGHSNTILIGDFNANPFEGMCVNADGLHGIPCKEVASRGERQVLSDVYKVFYNPMWNFLGDFNSPAGTYYYNSGGIFNLFWNVFDQVLFRPNIMGQIDKNSVQIITEINGNTLLDLKGRPNKKHISDHLPLYIDLKEDKDGFI